MITDTGVTQDMTIARAKEILRNLAEEGFDCPCCGQPAKVYERTITSSMAAGLIMIFCHFRDFQDEWLHLETFFKNKAVPSSIRADIPKLRFWNFLESRTGGKEDGNPNNGMYRITGPGKLFVLGEISAPKYKRIYNNKILSSSKQGDTITIHDALKNKFDYNKLLNS